MKTGDGRNKAKSEPVAGRKAASLKPVETLKNLLMFFAHFLDGAATYRGMSLYGYTEKHVLPTTVIQAVGTPAIMLPFKFLLVLALILVLDILFEEDLKRYPNLANIVKFGVVFLGLAPGVRDMIRITMGV